ncbi:flagellar hook-associated protein FlgL [Gryllotalpicola sp.]|uniref:flagellar hook-associated protein FlgL n=1 Tax=Gryllotalpicola sp. TaxID=1932787 RepID=UPI002633F0FC|nr:flagellar hook-associated protein FlgL [Gryllotalpicola sp.]
MSMRITNQTIYAAQQWRVQSSLQALANAQQAAASGKRITRPSDDPAGTSTALGVRASIAQNDQYSRNITDAQSWTTTTDSALTQTDTLLRKVRDLVVQASNGTTTAAAKSAIADQIDAIKQQLLVQANAKVGGRNAFAGTSSASGAYDTTTYAWAGSSSDLVQRRIGQNNVVQVDVNGSNVFGSGASSVFADLDGISTTLRANGNPQASLTAIDTRLRSVESAQATVGSVENAISAANSVQQSRGIALTQQQSDVENVDTAQAAINLTNQNNVYQAALLVSSKTMQTNLMDFLK